MTKFIVIIQKIRNCLGILHNYIELVFGTGHLYKLCTKVQVPKDNILTSNMPFSVWSFFVKKRKLSVEFIFYLLQNGRNFYLYFF